MLLQQDFDSRLSAFRLAKSDCRDKPPLLGNKSAVNGIRGTIAQNYTVSRLLPFLIGDFIQPDDEA